MYGTLYRIFNLINGKSYIGKTYNCFYDRLGSHIRDSKRFPNRPLYRAFHKYGVENFSAEILGEYREGLLEEKEAENIILYNSYGKTGYNATLGGDGKRYLSLNESYIITSYQMYFSIEKLARDLKVDRDSIKKVLLKNNIGIVNAKQTMRAQKSCSIYIPEVGLKFNDVYECIEFLRDCEIVDTKTTDKSASNSIHRVCKKERPSYKNIIFTY